MENEKKAYEPVEITKVEFEASDRITASACDPLADIAPPDGWCQFDS